jgi:hypothetical protein
MSDAGLTKEWHDFCFEKHPLRAFLQDPQHMKPNIHTTQAAEISLPRQGERLNIMHPLFRRASLILILWACNSAGYDYWFWLPVVGCGNCSQPTKEL